MSCDIAFAGYLIAADPPGLDSSCLDLLVIALIITIRSRPGAALARLTSRRSWHAELSWKPYKLRGALKIQRFLSALPFGEVSGLPGKMPEGHHCWLQAAFFRSTRSR